MKTKNRLLLQKITFILIIFQLCTSCMYAEPFGIRGNGVKATEKREVGNFSRLDVSAGFEVILTHGSQPEVVIEADDNLMRTIITKVEGKKLNIYVKGSVSPRSPMKAYITFVNLSEIELSGAVKLHSPELLDFDRLLLDLSGASAIEMETRIDALKADVSGASLMNLKGSANKADLECSGASNVKMVDFQVENMNLDLSGASSAEVWVTQNLKVDASGASKARYKGDPRITVDTSGASSVKKVD